MESGHIMIDFGGMDLTSESSQTITGLYARLTEACATGKMIVACNMVWGDTGAASPIPVIVTAPEVNTHVCATSTLQIHVTSADVVTIENMAPSNGGGN